MRPSTRAGRWVSQQTGPEGYTAFIPAPSRPGRRSPLPLELFGLSSAAAAARTWPTANAALQRLVGLGIVAETSGRRRDRLYIYTRLHPPARDPVSRDKRHDALPVQATSKWRSGRKGSYGLSGLLGCPTTNIRMNCASRSASPGVRSTGTFAKVTMRPGASGNTV